jgi:hypothetical protein
VFEEAQMSNPGNRTAHSSHALVASLSTFVHDPLVSAEERKEAEALAALVREEQARRDAERLAR